MDLDTIIASAKEFVLADGGHRPTLFVETSKPQIIIAELADMPPTPDARRTYFFGVGRKLGKERKGEALNMAAFVIMAWGSFQRADEPAPTVRPSQDPKRVEFLMIPSMRIEGQETHYRTEMFEVLKDAKGKFVDLLELSSEDSTAIDPFLFMLKAGFGSTNISDAKLQAHLESLRKTFGM